VYSKAGFEFAQITPQTFLDRCSAQAFPPRIFDESVVFRAIPQPKNIVGWVDLHYVNFTCNKRKRKTPLDTDSGVSPSS
jgi:hypothetical protein